MMRGLCAAAAVLAGAAHAGEFEVDIDYVQPASRGVMHYVSRFSYFDAKGEDPGHFTGAISFSFDPVDLAPNEVQGATMVHMYPTAYKAMCETHNLCNDDPPENLVTRQDVCKEIAAVASSLPDGIQIKFLSSVPVPTVPESEAEELMQRPVTQSQTNFWYVFVAECNISLVSGSKLPRKWHGDAAYSYGPMTVTVLNTQADTSWVYFQFSSELSGLNVIFLFFWLVFTGIIGANLFLQFRGSTTGILGMLGSHHVTRLFSVIIFLQGFEYFFAFCHYAVYADNGRGDIDLLGFAKFLGTLSQCGIIFLILLLAKGYTITSSELRNPKATFIVTGVMSLLYVVLFIIQTMTFTIYNSSPDTQIISWQTWAGIIILVLRVILGLYFLWEVRSTFMMEDGESQLRFYKIFAGGYFLWLISLPIIVCIAAACDYVVREKVVEVLFNLVNFVAVIMMAYLLRPRSNEFFKLTGDATTENEGESSLPYDSI